MLLSACGMQGQVVSCRRSADIRGVLKPLRFRQMLKLSSVGDSSTIIFLGLEKNSQKDRGNRRKGVTLL